MRDFGIMAAVTGSLLGTISAMGDTIETPLPDFSKLLEQPSGCIQRDELGNAVWNWTERGLSASQNLVPAILTIADDPRDGELGGTRVETIKPRQLGGGYNPYSTGPRLRKAPAPKRDLRALSRSIEEARRARAAAANVAQEAKA
jgi:hypothetical protein